MIADPFAGIFDPHLPPTVIYGGNKTYTPMATAFASPTTGDTSKPVPVSTSIGQKIMAILQKKILIAPLWMWILAIVSAILMFYFLF